MLNLFSLNDRVVVVTGASRGLGQAIAVAASAAGAHVIGVARTGEALEETANAARTCRGTFAAISLDLAEPAAVEQLVGELTTVSVWGVVHAAGNQLRKAAVEVTRAEWRQIHRLHVETSFFLSTRLAREQIASQLPGSHVFLGSLGSTIGARGVAPYTAAKAGVLGTMRTLALEWAPLGIRVNAIVPGYFETALTRDLLATPQERERIISRIPMGRLGVPADIAGAAIFLLADASSYMTGQVLTVDGGWLAS
jgi:2-dehydro-3-deoxy-D-gluconate 5-dehydrogenase